MKAICHYKEFNPNISSSIFDNVSDKAPKYKEKVINYLKSHKPTSFSPQMAVDLFSENKLDFSLYCSHDGVYYWRSDMIYYFEKYNLKLDDDFVSHVLNNV